MVLKRKHHHLKKLKEDTTHFMFCVCITNTRKHGRANAILFTQRTLYQSFSLALSEASESHADIPKDAAAMYPKRIGFSKQSFTMIHKETSITKPIGMQRNCCTFKKSRS
jgi:hypothetical protein